MEERSIDLSDPLHRAVVQLLLGVTAAETAGVLILLLVRMTQFWLMPLTAAVSLGCTVLMIRIARKHS